MDKRGDRQLKQYCTYDSPLGTIFLLSEGECLTVLAFEGQKYFERYLPALEYQPAKYSSEKVMAGSGSDATGGSKGRGGVLYRACRWLDSYFSGNVPGETVPVSLHGTEFQLKVWRELEKIPYGTVVTYGELAQRIFGPDAGGLKARAVGNAVGKNPISIIIPCHRVIGSDSSLTGYAGGVDKKIDRKSTRLNSSHSRASRMPSSA